MGNYLKPIPPHSGLTGLLGGNSSTGEYYHLGSDDYAYLQALYSGTAVVSATTIYSGGTDLNELLNGGSQYRVIYVAKNGSGIDGSTASRAFTTLAAAIQYYTSNYNDASATKPFTIRVVDTGSYSLSSSLVIPNHVAIDARLSDVYGPTVLGDGSKLWVKNHYPRTSFDSPLVTKSAITTTSYYKADVVDARGSGGTGNLGIVFQSSGSTGQMFLDVKKLYVTTKGIGSFGGTANGHIHLNIEDLYLASNNATAIRTEGGPNTSIVGYVHHILESSSGISNTLAFELAGGRISIISTEIFADTFAYVVYGFSSQLDIVCPYINVTTQYATDLGQDFQIDYMKKRVISSSFPSQIMSGLTAGPFYADSASAVTFYSGSTDLSHLLGQESTYVQPGLNVTTGGTPNAPIVNLAGTVILTGLTAASLSGNTLYSGNTDLNYLLGSPAVWQSAAGVTDSIEPVSAPNTVNSDNSIAFGGTIGLAATGAYAFGRNSSISDGSESASILGGDTNTIGLWSYYSSIIGGIANSIGDTVFASTIIGGEFSVIEDSVYESFIIGGASSTIQDSSQYSSVFGGVGGIIGPHSYASSILGGINNNAGASAHTSSIIGGFENLVSSFVSGSTILGGFRITASTTNTAYVPYLNIGSAITSGSTYVLALQADGGVTKMAYEVSTGSTTYVQPGLNITTGGTANLPIVNLSGSISVTAVTATEYHSGGTPLNHLLGATERTYRKRVSQTSHGLEIGHLLYVHSDGTYQKATNGSFAGCNTVGMVTNVFDSDDFEITSEGYVDMSGLSTVLPSLVAGATYYLTTDPDTIAVTPTPGEYKKAVLIATSESSFYILNGTEIVPPEVTHFSLFREEIYMKQVPPEAVWMGGDEFYPIRFNLMSFIGKKQARLMAFVNTATTKGNFVVRYSDAYTSSFASYLAIGAGTTDIACDITSSDVVDSGWIDIDESLLAGELYVGWGTEGGDNNTIVMSNGILYLR